MLDNHDGVAQVAQLLEHLDEAVSVARVEAYGGLVEDVHAAHQRAAKRGGQVDALALAAAETVGEAVQRQVSQAHVEQVAHAVVQLHEQTVHHLLFMLGEGQGVEPCGEIAHRHGQQVGDGLAVDFDVGGILAEARPFAVGAGRLAAETREHHAVLYLVGLGLDPLEESVDAFPRAAAVPEDVALLVCEVAVGRVDGEVQLGSLTDEVGLPFLHLVAFPAHHSVAVDREALVGHHHVLVDAYHRAVAPAGGAGSVGVVEAEEVGVGLLEGDAVGLEPVGEGGLALFVGDDTSAAALEECRLDRLGDAGRLVVVAVLHLHAVHQQAHYAVLLLDASCQVVLNPHHRPAHADAHKTLLLQHLQLSPQGAFVVVFQRGEEGRFASFGQGVDIVDHVAHRVALHLHA